MTQTGRSYGALIFFKDFLLQTGHSYGVLLKMNRKKDLFFSSVGAARL